MKNKSNVSSALKWAEAELKKNGVPDAEVEAEYLLCHVLKAKRHELYLNPARPLTEKEAATLDEFVQRRIKREPSQYIAGETEFRGHVFKVTKDVLIPRPETELLVEEALKAAKGFKGERITAIDLCTGSGCIAVSLAKELEGCRVYATDISEAALEVAKENARLNGVEGRVTFLKGDLFEALPPELTGQARLVLSNPPYVSEKDMKGLAPEILDYEPHNALYGGEDGLDFYRRILRNSPSYLRKGGWVILELGYGQAKSVKTLAEKEEVYEAIDVRKDYSGIERVFQGRKK